MPVPRAARAVAWRAPRVAALALRWGVLFHVAVLAAGLNPPGILLTADNMRSYRGVHNVLKERLHARLEQDGRLLEQSPPPAAQLFDQILNHLEDNADRASAATWQQRFWVDASLWGGAGYPVFLSLGGEGPAGPPDPSYSLMGQMAAEHHALMISLEHRFYGESLPHVNATAEQLKVLSSAQALADAAHFIQSKGQELEASPEAGSSWVVFGGSYSGNLAAWLRLKYPHLVAAAVASSAPVHAQYDFYQYNAVVTRSLAALGGPECAAMVGDASSAFAEQAGTAGGRAHLQARLNPCQALANRSMAEAISALIVSAVQTQVQYNQLGNGIGEMCAAGLRARAGAGGDALAGLAGILYWTLRQPYPPANRTKTCIGPRGGGGGGGGLSHSLRMWYYQLCNEFGQSSCEPGSAGCGAASTPPDCFSGFGRFGDGSGGLSKVDGICQELFNITATPPAAWTGHQVGWTNVLNGGYRVMTSNVLYVNGEIDPYHSVSVTPSVITPMQEALGNVALMIPNASHCADMAYLTDDDPAPMQSAKRYIKSYVAWVLGKSDKPTMDVALAGDVLGRPHHHRREGPPKIAVV